MDIQLLKDCALLLTAMVASAMIVAKCRRFFERKPGEPWLSFFQRARDEQQKDHEARQTMFGTRPATIKADLVNLVLVLGSTLTVYHPSIMGMLFLYLLVGFYVSRSIAHASRTAEHARLTMSDRFWFRLYFAWIWIFNIQSKRT
jgi:hypothetical protein